MVCFGYQRKRSGRWLTLVQMQQMLVAFTFTTVIKKGGESALQIQSQTDIHAMVLYKFVL